MKKFGKKAGGGQRKSARVKAPAPALLTTFSSSCTCVLVDISATGARVRGDGPFPKAGSEVAFKVAAVEVFGMVAWSEEQGCGIRFDEPLATYDQMLIDRDVTITRAAGVTPEDRIALRDWTFGIAR